VGGRKCGIRAAARRRRPPMQGPGWQPGGRYGGDPAAARRHVRALQVCGTQTHTNAHKCTHMHIHVIIRTHSHTHKCARAHTHTHTHEPNARSHGDARLVPRYPMVSKRRVHTHTHTCTHTPARTHARTHARARAHTLYIYMHVLKDQTVNPAQTT
jgi:hypothetical protein